MQYMWSHPGKPLNEHLNSVAKIAVVNLCSVPLNYDEIGVEKEILANIVRLAALYHDIGKATCFFQEYIKEGKKIPESTHSMLSAAGAFFAIDEYFKEKQLDDRYSDFINFLKIAAFIAVRRHHTDLKAVLEDLRLEEEILEILKKQIEKLDSVYLSYLPYWENVFEKLKNLPGSWTLKKSKASKLLNIDKNKEFLLYIIQHLIYSILLDADKLDVVIGSNIIRKSFPSTIIDDYRVFKGFDKPTIKIDYLRNEIYNKVLKQIDKINLSSSRFFSLSAPTGGGKTLTAVAFAIKLRELINRTYNYCPRIIYSLPFLSIIDQNAKVIKEIFANITSKEPSSEIVLVHHHLSDYFYTGEDTEYGPNESEILIEGWESEIIVTTFVQFFHTLFSNRNRAIRKFHKIAGSIIILDEIQTFPHEYWELFKKIGTAMAKYFNTYFILSTATQPIIFDNPEELLDEKEKFFKALNRARINIKIDSTKSYGTKTIKKFVTELKNEILKNPKSTLIVLNTIRAAEEVFNELKELRQEGYAIYFLSSYVIPIERLKRIEEIKQKKNKEMMLVVSTQLVEAGVDIDFERVIRDLSPLDSINQVAGRANRNFNFKIGEVEVIELIEDSTKFPFWGYIYDPVLIKATREILKSASTFEEKNFIELIGRYFKKLRDRISTDESKKCIDAIKKLNYEEIAEFKLIKERIRTEDIFIEFNDEATEIWRQYTEICEQYKNTFRKEDFWKIKEKFLGIRNKFYQYVISVAITREIENLPPRNFGIRFVSKAQIEDFYNLDTGFKSKAEVAIW